MATFVYEAAKQAPRMTMVHRPIETTCIIEHEIVVSKRPPEERRQGTSTVAVTNGLVLRSEPASAMA